MANEKRDVLLIGPSKPAVERGLAGFTLHNLAAAKNREAFFGSIGHVRAMAWPRRSSGSTIRSSPACPGCRSLPASASVTTTSMPTPQRGAASWSRNTPEVLTEEVADTALGLLLCTVRELPQAERHLRGGKWPRRRLSADPGDAAQPHRRHGRPGPHRQRHRPPARSLRRADRLSYAPAAARGRATATIPTSSRWRAMSTPDGHRAGRRRHREPDRRQGARRRSGPMASSSTSRRGRWSMSRV